MISTCSLCSIFFSSSLRSKKPQSLADIPMMEKQKTRGQGGLGQKHLYSRASYLYQAATYLASPRLVAPTLEEYTESDIQRMFSKGAKNLRQNVKDGSEPASSVKDSKEASRTMSAQQLPLSRLLINHLKAISLKTQIRLTTEIKHSTCRRCDTLLVPGSTSTSSLENKSRGGKKNWADVFVITCNSCGTVKRFPVSAKHQSRRPSRAMKKGQGETNNLELAR